MRVKRSSLTIVVVIAATVLVSGSQCARVNDQALGPAVQTQDQPVSLCFKACAQTAKEMRQAEQARFIAAIQACTDPQCRQEQASIHQENLQQIEMAQEECEAGCHEQGGGSGGE